MEKIHQYSTKLVWTGNKGAGTSGYRSYSRDHSISVDSKPTILACSDPAFMGDASRHNPEDFLVASLSSCHMLWYLHLCADAGVVVVNYDDEATGVMKENENGGSFVEVTLHPTVVVQEKSMMEKAQALHADAHSKCFIANSVNFPVKHIVNVKAFE